MRPPSTPQTPAWRRPAGRSDSWTKADYADHGRVATLAHRVVLRRRRTRARVRAMPWKRRILRRSMILGTYFLGFVAVLMVGVIIAYFEFTDVPQPADVALPQVATIEYADGSTLATVGPIDHTIVNLSQVPTSTRWAVLAAEDRNFYNDGAVSITGTLRAALVDLSGGARQGGSGITQQYVKNAYLNSSTTLTRKLKELMIAVKLSREYSKDEILGFYLNTVYFGRGAYGIQAAAKAYFNEDVSQLTVAQGALLAAVLRAPSYYDPAVNLDQAKARWNYVIQGMVTTGHLTKAQAAATPFPQTIAPTGTGVGTNGWKALVVHAVLAELAAHGISNAEVNARGLTIRTTISPQAQTAALNAVNTTFAHINPDQKNLKTSLVAVDPSSGAVLAYYPGSGPGVPSYSGQVDYNDWAQQFGNSPGSTFKPIVLSTVLQQTINQKVGDGQIHYAINSLVNGTSPQMIGGVQIHNDPSDAAYSRNNITIAYAMRYSLNTVFDSLAEQAGPNNVAAMAHTLGVATTNSAGEKTLVDSDGQTSFGIGIGDYPVTTLDMANVYSTFAAGGVRHPSFMVAQATASDGTVVYQHKGSAQQVIDPRIANDVTLTLEQVAADSGRGLAGGRMSAAKTGTEGLTGDSKQNSDAWTVGYTPQVSAAVWVGSGARQPILNSAGNPMYGRDEPGQEWQLFMNNYLAAIKAPKLPLATTQELTAQGTTYTPPPTPTYVPVPTPTKTATPTPTPTPSPSPTPTPTPTPTVTPSPTPTPSRPCLLCGPAAPSG